MDKKGLRKQLLASLDAVQWIPASGQARIRSMIENRPDWCISRQRQWGSPIPLFLHKETQALHPDSQALMEKVACLIEKEGIEAWFKLDPASLLGEEAKTYVKCSDTLDVWFDAGVSHECVLRQKNLAFPASLYLEGTDQHRGWFNSSLTTSVAIQNAAPYRAVLTHGYTVDAEGKKLSKSKGNYVALEDIIHKYGADVVRLWVSSTDYRNEVTISEEIMTRVTDTYRRIRNTARFMLSNLFDFDPKVHQVSIADMVELDQWAIMRAKSLQTELIDAYETYQFHLIYQKIHHFCAMDMGSFYLDIIKDRQYTTAVNSVARRSCQTAMYHILQGLSRWLAPILSFTAEEIWQAMPCQNEASIFLQQWYDAWPTLTQNLDDWTQILLIRDEVNKAIEAKRREGVVGSSLAAHVVIYAKGKSEALLSRLCNELRFVLITSIATLKPMSDCSPSAVESKELGIAIEVLPTDAVKCNRCWHRSHQVGDNLDYPDLCPRCVINIQGSGEKRQFA